MSLTQLKRLRAGKAVLSADVGSQLFLFALILTRAEDVFGSRDAALDWLQKPQPLLEGRRPIELLDTFVGAASLDRTLRLIGTNQAGHVAKEGRSGLNSGHDAQNLQSRRAPFVA